MSRSAYTLNQLFSLTLADLEALPPREKRVFAAGVYVVTVPSPDAVVKVLYVGQSGDVYQRLTTHKRTKNWWPKGPKVLYYPLAKTEDRLVLETLLILRYRPRYNKAVKLGLDSDGKIYEMQWLRGKK